MPTDFHLACKESTALDLFLALHRELMGRYPWEVSLVPTPVVREIDQFRDGIRAWRAAGLDTLPSWIAEADTATFGEGSAALAGSALKAGARQIGAALRAAEPHLRPAIDAWASTRAECAAVMRKAVENPDVGERLRAAVGGGGDEPFTLSLYLVPYAPSSPGAGFLTDNGRRVSAFVDCRRFRGEALTDSILTLTAWALLQQAPGAGSLPAVLATRLPGGSPYHRRLRAVLTKILVEITAGDIVQDGNPMHRPCVDLLGTVWRFPRLYAAAYRHWKPYLSGAIERDAAIDGLTSEVSGRDPAWYIDHVDAASLAADFYLMESLIAMGEAEAEAPYAMWLPRLAESLAAQLDVIIGIELGHYERARTGKMPASLADFVERVSHERSQLAWARARIELGQSDALRLAEQAFDGPGTEFGGKAWAPVAALMRRYVRHEIPETVFVDQCFTMQHNNGSLFDKYFETRMLPAILDAQARGDMAELARYASDNVRHRWHAFRRSRSQRHDFRWLASPEPWPSQARPAGTLGLTALDAAPGDLGCGFPGAVGDSGSAPDQDRPVATRSRRQQQAKRILLPLRRYDRAEATLHTPVGDVDLRLWPDVAPYAVDNFVLLARGERIWRDPDTHEEGIGGFYDGTLFHRRIPGFLVQGGDRSGTGQCGPGYRIPDEFCKDRGFDRPFLLAMANLGPTSTGSQFFITLSPAPHLDGGFTQFGEVLDPASMDVVEAIAAAPDPVVLTTVDVRAESAG